MFHCLKMNESDQVIKKITKKDIKHMSNFVENGWIENRFKVLSIKNKCIWDKERKREREIELRTKFRSLSFQV